VTTEQLRDLAEMANLEFLLIDEHTDLEDFKNSLRWNDVYYQMSGGL
jgi:L-arabinose isomerase